MPVIDTSIVIVNRLLKGRSPFIGGKDHTTHHLVYMGFSERKVAFIFAFVGFISISLTYFINAYFVAWGPFHVVFFALYFLLLLGSFYFITKKFLPVT
jgi:UDP-GlcNAc:undecaprenyl-phosphate GlcNAc-1-phosphate transferase